MYLNYFCLGMTCKCKSNAKIIFSNLLIILPKIVINNSKIFFWQFMLLSKISMPNTAHCNIDSTAFKV